MADTAEAAIEREFSQVQKTRDDLLAKRAEIDEQLAAIDQRYTNLINARAALQGKFTAPVERKMRKPRQSSGTRAPRGSREELKGKILDLVKQHPDGLVSKQITDTFPDQAKAIPNLLNLMKKDNHLHQDARRGPYYIPT
jgi:hypothetical protein